MRARIKLRTTDTVKETIYGVLREHHWMAAAAPTEVFATRVIQEVLDSVEDRDSDLFTQTEKVVLVHQQTDSSGTLSFEHDVWVFRVLNPSVHLLQIACEDLVRSLGQHSLRNKKTFDFEPIQIVERQRKEAIIEGSALPTSRDRWNYAKLHRATERAIAVWGGVAFFLLLAATFPGPWWPGTEALTCQPVAAQPAPLVMSCVGPTLNSGAFWVWLKSVLEKLIGSVAITSIMAGFQYVSFHRNLSEHSIRWFIPGEPERRDVRPRTTRAAA